MIEWDMFFFSAYLDVQLGLSMNERNHGNHPHKIVTYSVQLWSLYSRLKLEPHPSRALEEVQATEKGAEEALAPATWKAEAGGE